MAKDIEYIIVALYIFDNAFPIFTDLVGTASNSEEAFDKLEAYDCEKVIAADYDMDVTRVEKFGRRYRKWLGKRSEKMQFEYSEERYFKYRIKDCKEDGFVTVVYTIYSV